MSPDTTWLGSILNNLAHLVSLGGPIVAVLLAMSVFGLAIVLLKLWQFAGQRVGRRRFVEPALSNWRQQRPQAAQQVVAGERNPVAQTLAVAMHGIDTGVDTAIVREEAARFGARHLSSLRSYLRALEVIGSVAPLLGLLGTVLGMIDVFSQLASAGGSANPSMLSGGIWEALLTTAIGLIVAVPAVLALNWLERIVERLHEDMQDALTQVFTHRDYALSHATDDRLAATTAGARPAAATESAEPSVGTAVPSHAH